MLWSRARSSHFFGTSAKPQFHESTWRTHTRPEPAAALKSLSFNMALSLRSSKNVIQDLWYLKFPAAACSTSCVICKSMPRSIKKSSNGTESKSVLLILIRASGPMTISSTTSRRNLKFFPGHTTSSAAA